MTCTVRRRAVFSTIVCHGILRGTRDNNKKGCNIGGSTSTVNERRLIFFVFLLKIGELAVLCFLYLLEKTNKRFLLITAL